MSAIQLPERQYIKNCPVFYIFSRRFPPCHKQNTGSRYNIAMTKWIKVALVSFCVFLIYIFCSIAWFSTVDEKKTADAAIILGAAAWYKRPSPVFEERINHGIWLYKNGYVKKLMEENHLFSAIIVSDPMHMRRAMQIANDLGIKAWSSPTPSTKYASWQAKIQFLFQETWHMIAYIVYPSASPEPAMDKTDD